MKKISIIILMLLVASLFVGCFDNIVYPGHDTLVMGINERLFNATHDGLYQAMLSYNNTEGIVYLPKNCALHIVEDFYVPENIRLFGAGSTSLLVLEKRFRVYGVDNVHLKDFDINGSGKIQIVAPGWDVSGFHLENINAYSNRDYGKSPQGSIYLYANRATISDIVIRNVNAYHVPRMSMFFGGEGSPSLIKDFLIEDCEAIGCGDGIDGNWSTAYDFTEYPDLENGIIRRCKAIDSYESGFHFESKPKKKNILIEDCESNYNGRKPDQTYGSGFLVTPGMTVRNCKSKGNARMGFWCHNNDVTQEIQLINCEDEGSRIGLRVGDGEAKTTVRNFVSNNAQDYGFRVINTKNIILDNIIVNNYGGSSNYSYDHMLGSAPYPLENATIDIHITGGSDPNQVLLFCQGAKNVTISGSIDANSKTAMYIAGGEDVVIDGMDIENIGQQGILGYKATDLYIKNTIVGGILQYGIRGSINDITVQESTVSVTGAGTPYEGVTFV